MTATSISLLLVWVLGFFPKLSWVAAFHVLPHKKQWNPISSSRWQSVSSETATPSSFTDDDNNKLSKESTDEILQELLSNARRLGPFGCYASSSEQGYLRSLARALRERGAGNPSPGRQGLTGSYSLIYTDSDKISSGRIGFLHGRVVQEFIANDQYINRLQLGDGFLELALRADRTPTSDHINAVSFRNVTLRIFGNDVWDGTIGGEGVWDYQFIGPVHDEQTNQDILLRVLQVPESLFLLEQPLPSPN